MRRLTLILVCLATLAATQESASEVVLETDLDAFMQKALERREVNWEKVQDFIFHEQEDLELQGFDIAAEESFRKEYDWYYRGGNLVRRLVRSDGVKVEGPERRWNAKEGKTKPPLSRRSFFGFKFQPGNYFLAGRDEFEGNKVLVVEYYPQNLFEDEDHGKRDDDEREFEEAFEKTSRVRLWILPDEHQIVKMTFDNVGLEFLPYRWLVRIDDIRATLIMGQPIAGVWLPREIFATGRVSTAAASLRVQYERKFLDYREADVNVRFKFEGPESKDGSDQPPPR